MPAYSIQIGVGAKNMHVTETAEQSNMHTDHCLSSPSTLDSAPEKIPLPDPEDDTYGAEEEHRGKKKQIMLEDIPLESEKKVDFDERYLEEPGPPSYAPPTADAVEQLFWKSDDFCWLPLKAWCC